MTYHSEHGERRSRFLALSLTTCGLALTGMMLAACVALDSLNDAVGLSQKDTAGAEAVEADPASLDPSSPAFDHFLTGFPLEGAHVAVSCDGCHSSADFKIRSTRCADCHDGRRAGGKDPSHFVTTLACETCHEASNRWIRIRFSHNSPNYPGDHRGNLDCLECHTTNNQAPFFEFPQFAPTCGGCHADDFENDEHDQGVAELRDCGGACHDDDGDIDFGEHRVTDGDFD